MAEERLQKILSRAGVASRRAAEELILGGHVEINGKIVRELGTKADPSKDVIRVDKALIAEPEDKVYYVLYKPERVVTTLEDPEGRTSVGKLVGRISERVYPVGRLDYDAEGALILTNDGDLAHKLTHPRWGVQRTYLAKVKGEPADEVLQRMVEGVRLEDGRANAVSATFEKRTPKNTWIKIVVTEGRHHLVKRLCEAVGHPVVRLFRSDYAGIGVSGLGPGDFRPLSAIEVRALRKAVEKEAPPPPGGLRRKRAGARPAAVRDPILGTARRAGPGRAGEGFSRGPARGGFGEGRGRPAGGEGFSRGPARGGFGEGRGRPAGGEGFTRGPARGGFGEGRGRPAGGEGFSRGPARGGFGEGRGRPAGGEGFTRGPARGGFGEGRGRPAGEDRGFGPEGEERLSTGARAAARFGSGPRSTAARPGGSDRPRGSGRPAGGRGSAPRGPGRGGPRRG